MPTNTGEEINKPVTPPEIASAIAPDTSLKVSQPLIAGPPVKVERNFVTLKELATIIGYSYRWTFTLVRAGRIKAIKPTGGRWQVPLEEVERLKTEGIMSLKEERTRKIPKNKIVIPADLAARILGPRRKPEPKPEDDEDTDEETPTPEPKEKDSDYTGIRIKLW